MTKPVVQILLGRLNTSYYRDNPFVEERMCYLAHPFERGCLRETMIGTGKVGVLAQRVSITAAGFGSAPQIEGRSVCLIGHRKLEAYLQIRD